MTKKLFVLLPLMALLFTGCSSSSAPSKQKDSDSSSQGCNPCSESESESPSSSDAVPSGFDVKFYVNTQTFASWDPVPNGYFIHAWNASGGLDTWGEALMTAESENLYSYVYHFEEGGSITGVVFAFKQGNDTKQTVDMACNITEAGNYQIQYDGSDWRQEGEVWKMNASIIPYTE